MTIEQAFVLVKNLDYKETHRRFAPQYGLLQFNSSGEVVSIYRYKTTPHEPEQFEAISKHPGCLQISTMPHWFETAQELQERIDKNLWIFAHMKP
jgi:hypothetical protein